MPVKRRVPKERRQSISTEVVAAFKAGDKATLDRLLGVKPWAWSPLEAEGPMPPYLQFNPWQAGLWREANELRGRILAVIEAEAS